MIVLRDYQDDLVGEARARLAAGCRRLVVQSSAGSGKTVIASFMVAGATERKKRTMFMVHREELAHQAARTFRGFGIPHSYVMASMTMDSHQPALIAMVDTLRNRLAKVPRPDMLIVDECHHATSVTWKKIIDYYYQQGTIIIGLSATPQRLDGRALSDCFDEMVMGPTPRSLINIGALSDYTYYRPPTLVDLTSVKIRAGDYATDELAAAVDKPAIIGDAVEHYQRLLSGKRAIAFAVSIKHSEHIAQQFREAGIPAAHVDGETPTRDRIAIVQAFTRGEILVMSNVSLFGEGFDVPACEGMIGLRPTQSLSLHIQMCGRPMRPHGGKGKAIIIDHVNNLKLHGLPDEEREWTLDGRKKRNGKRVEEDDAVNIMQCPDCYLAHLPAPVCPGCGHVYEKAGRQLEQTDGELVEVTEADKEAIRHARQVEIKKAKTIAELEAIAAQRGYSPNWAKHTLEARQRARAKHIGRYYEEDHR